MYFSTLESPALAFSVARPSATNMRWTFAREVPSGIIDLTRDDISSSDTADSNVNVESALAIVGAPKNNNSTTLAIQDIFITVLVSGETTSHST